MEEAYWVCNKIKADQLSGQEISPTIPLRYITESKVNSSLVFIIDLQNKKAFPQEGRSCIIFSIKALVTSIIGLDLTTLHSHFMQHGGNMVDIIENKIARLEQSIRQCSYASTIPHTALADYHLAFNT